MERYNFKEIDSKWQKIWNEKKIYNDRIQNGIPIAEEAWNLITLRAKSLSVDDLNRFQKAVY